MLGDTADDITAAKQAGVVPIGVIAPGATRERTEAVLNGAARILGSVSELEVMLDAQGI
jgi:phosphoglycolate phosphatase-like HAD superfamily hydrolase